jgi:PIN domain nuclease of toxin-antitoxin system
VGGPGSPGEEAAVKLLLDTHIWIWSLLQPSKLHGRVSKALVDAGSELWLSPISVWEFLMLHEKERVAVAGNPRDWIARALQKIPIKEAPLTHEVALATHSAGLAHRDPADRFLTATALVYDLTLVTADERLIKSGKCRILAN